MRLQDKSWLVRIANMEDTPGRYKGMREDHLPESVALRLKNQNMIYCDLQENPVHKDRWRITQIGLEALAARQGGT